MRFVPLEFLELVRERADPFDCQTPQKFSFAFLVRFSIEFFIEYAVFLLLQAKAHNAVFASDTIFHQKTVTAVLAVGKIRAMVTS